MIEKQIKTCPVCGDEFPYYDVRNVPATCHKIMCRTNYRAYSNRSTVGGDKPDIKEMGVWKPSRDYEKKSKKEK